MVTPYFERLEVEIKNDKFTNALGVTFPMTATLIFFDDKDKVILAKDYGHIPTNQIYEQIENNKAIELDYCYVYNFSIATYLQTRILSKKSFVDIKSISAKGAFFHSTHTIDLSYLKISDSIIDFSEACFYANILTLAHTNFGNKNVDFSYCFFNNSKVDFSNSIFGEGEVSFKNSKFKSGEKNFQYTDFGNGNLSFVNTDFGNGDTIFLNSNFNTGDVSFKVANFGSGKVDFHYANFGLGNISFERTSFGEGGVDFRTVEFGKGKVNFNRSIFGSGEVNFEAVQAKGRITFKRTNFGKGGFSFELAEMEEGEVTFEKADFGDSNISFFNSSFKSLNLQGCHLDQYCDLRVNKCLYVDLSDTIVRDIIDFKPYKSKVKISTLNISGMRLLGTIYIDWEHNNVLNIIKTQNNTTLESKAEQFRTLKESFNKVGQYTYEDHAYVWFKRYELKAQFKHKSQKSKIKSIVHYPEFFMKKLLFDWAGLYATNPFRVMISMITTYTLFSFIYVIVLLNKIGGIESALGGKHDAIGIIGRSFYHSGITFLTIGYGDFYPIGAVRWLSNIEGFVGVFLMSYFTVAFVRKILR